MIRRPALAAGLAFMAAAGCSRSQRSEGGGEVLGSPAADVRPAAAGDAGSDAGGLGEGGAPADAGVAERASPPPPPAREPGDGFESFRAGRFRCGRSSARAPRAPVVLWTFKAGDAIRAQPVVARDGTVLVPSLDGTLYALSPEGDLRWTFPSGDRIYSTPWAAEAGLIIFGSDADSLFALDDAGAVRWTLLRPEDSERPELHDVDTAPLVSRASVLVGAGLYLYSVDLGGIVRWRVATGGKVFSSPAALPDGTVVVGSQDGLLWAVRPDGGVRWKYGPSGDVDSTPAVDDVSNAIYVGADDGKVHAVSFGGERLWSTDVGGFVRAGIAVDSDGFVYASTFGPVARLVALDPHGGWIRWTVDAGRGPTAEYGIRSSPVVDAAGVVLIGAPGGTVRAVDRSGATLWRLDVPSDVDAGPILADDGTVYFGSDDGTFYAVGEAPAAMDGTLTPTTPGTILRRP